MNMNAKARFRVLLRSTLFKGLKKQKLKIFIYLLTHFQLYNHSDFIDRAYQSCLHKQPDVES